MSHNAQEDLFKSVQHCVDKDKKKQKHFITSCNLFCRPASHWGTFGPEFAGEPIRGSL